jgi:O-antigen/teichoic acid export membrane protein
VLGVIAITWVVKRWGPPRCFFRGLLARLRHALNFSIGGAFQIGTAEIDKTLLARFSTLEVTGIYGAAHRIIIVSFFPLMAFLAAVYPRFFEAGRSGIVQAQSFAWRIIPVVLIYTIAAAFTLWYAAPWIANILGIEYSETEDAIRILLILLVVQGLQYPFADALTGSGFQGLRTVGQGTAVVLSILLNVWLIPIFGWKGAAWAAVVTHIALLGFFLTVVLAKCYLASMHESRDSE